MTSFAKSRPPASASSSLFNVFSPAASYTSSASSESSSAPASNVASWFSESKAELGDAGDASDSSTSSTSFAGYIVRFILIVLLLGFAGFNVFKEMGLITDDILEFVRPVTEFGSSILATVGKQFVSTTSEGTRTGIDIVSGAAKSGVNVIEDQVTGKGISAPVSESDDPSVVPSSGCGTAKQEAARARALTMKTGSQLTDLQAGPQPDDSLSVTQKGKTSGKSGYCFIGEDRGHRSCIYVNESETCMSGNIFPSKDKCINPSLRA